MGRKEIGKAMKEARPNIAMFEAPLLFPFEGLGANPGDKDTSVPEVGTPTGAAP